MPRRRPGASEDGVVLTAAGPRRHTDARPMKTAAYHGSLPVAALLVATVLLGPAAARGQISADLDAGRSRTDVGFGLGVNNGSLHFEARQYEALPPDLSSETTLGAVPQGWLQVRHWQSRSVGVRATVSLGLLPALEVPSTVATTATGEPVELQLLTHELELAFLYRLHFGSSSTALAAQFEVAVEHLGYDVQETDPAVLVSTSYVGPRASAGVHVPLGSSFCLTATAGLLLPLYVSEDPVDSGRAEKAWGLALALAAEARLSEALSLQLVARRTDLAVEFGEHGTRGLAGNGVYQASTEELFQTVALQLHMAL